MKRKIVLFDVDRTLIDADAIENMIYQKISEQTGLDVNDLKKIKDKYRENLSGYSVESLIDHISEITGTNLDVLKEYLNDKSIFKKYIYGDVEKTLEMLKDNFDLGIFSDGFYEYQTKKISSILKYFNKDLIFVTDGKLNYEYLNKLPKNAIIIDDLTKVIEKLKSDTRFKLIWINRITDEKIRGVTTIKNLGELVDLII